MHNQQTCVLLAFKSNAFRLPVAIRFAFTQYDYTDDTIVEGPVHQKRAASQGLASFEGATKRACVVTPLFTTYIASFSKAKKKKLLPGSLPRFRSDFALISSGSKLHSQFRLGRASPLCTNTGFIGSGDAVCSSSMPVYACAIAWPIAQPRAYNVIQVLCEAHSKQPEGGSSRNSACILVQ